MNLRGRNGTFGGIFVGLVFFGIGLIFFIVFGQSYTLRCTRPEPSQIRCARERRLLRAVPLGAEPVAGLAQAWVGESCDDDGCTYRVEMATEAGEIAFTGYYSSGYEEKAVAASEINTFLADPRIPELEVRSDAGLFAFLLPMIFMVAGLAFILAYAYGVLRPFLGRA
jgi:hypothetical protein